MKKFLSQFFLRGLVGCGFGPLVLAAIYLILQRTGDLQILTVNEVCLGIVTLSGLAFMAGGMNAVYQIERLPLMAAIGLHGGVLYVSYLAVYLLNGWLRSDPGPLLVFTVIFVLGYLAIWAVIYAVTRRKTEKLNAVLRQIQERE